MIIENELYSQILRVMPIPCIDLIIEDALGRLLLARRANEPARGQWWFPGGRIHYLETRLQAAKRKLKEECGLEAVRMIELGTYDVIVTKSDDSAKIHGITTIFHVHVGRQIAYVLDSQNSEAEWLSPEEWLKLGLPHFVEQGLRAFMEKYVK